MKRIMIDAQKCDGCKNCVVACMNAHRDQPGTVYNLNLADGKTLARNFIYQDKKGSYYPVFCRHCDEPDCVAACMSHALTKNPESGLVEYNKDLCAVCYMCVMSCRFGLPRPDREKSAMLRCTFCQDTEEREPQCVKACPTKAISVREV